MSIFTLMQRLRSNCISVLAIFFTLGLGANALASDKDSGGRIGVDIMLYRSTFEQSGLGQSMSLGTDPSLSFGLRAGMQISGFYIEYHGYFDLSYLTSESAGNNNDITCFSLGGGNIGYKIPTIDLEFFAGLSWNMYFFANGADTDFRGLSYRLGTSLRILGGGSAKIRLRGEYEIANFSASDFGALPDEIDSSAKIVRLGISFQFD